MRTPLWDLLSNCIDIFRYEHDVALEFDHAVIRFPVPGQDGEKLIARQHSQPSLWNASQMFSFIAWEIQVMNYPGKITNIKSSHSINTSIEESNAVVELDDYMFQVFWSAK